MPWPTIRSGSDFLRTFLIGAGLCWSVGFVVIALYYQLELYADGAMFSYAVAVQDVWAFHWHNISGRLSVFLLILLPAEVWVGLTRKPSAGILVYGLLFYLAPLAGLIGTLAADRSRNRIIFVYACCSTALLCPLVFGFPSEMWLAHAMFWPTLAVSHYASRTVGGTALVCAMLLTLAFTHEGALVLTFSIVAMLALRGVRRIGGAVRHLSRWSACSCLTGGRTRDDLAAEAERSAACSRIDAPHVGVCGRNCKIPGGMESVQRSGSGPRQQRRIRPSARGSALRFIGTNRLHSEPAILVFDHA